MSTAVPDTIKSDFARLAVIGLAAGPLTFPLQVPWLTGLVVACVTAFLTVDLFARGRLSWPISFTASIFVLSVMVMIGTVTTPAPHLTAPKAYSLFLGLAVMVTVDRVVRTRRRLWIAAAVCVAVGIAAATAGSLSATWQWKFSGLGELAQSMPRGLQDLPGADGGVNTNALGAAVLLVLPGFTALLVGAFKSRIASDAGVGRTELLVLRLLAGPLAVAMLFVLLLSQSRSAWFALLGSAGIFVGLVSRWMAALVGGVAAVVLAGTMVFGLDYVTSSVELSVRRLGIAGEHFRIQPEERLKIWKLALSELQSSPIQGVGLGAFRQTVRHQLSAEEPAPVHAHNVFIQTALDVGLVGLAAYCTVIAIGLTAAWSTFVHAEPTIGWIAIGMGGNILAIHIFGLVDAVALGAKLGGLLWASLGVVMAARHLGIQTPTGDRLCQ